MIQINNNIIISILYDKNYIYLICLKLPLWTLVFQSDDLTSANTVVVNLIGKFKLKKSPVAGGQRLLEAGNLLRVFFIFFFVSHARRSVEGFIPGFIPGFYFLPRWNRPVGIPLSGWYHRATLNSNRFQPHLK